MGLRTVEPGDLDHFFEHQSDPAAYNLAQVRSRDRQEFDALWERLLADPEIHIRTIDVDQGIAGYVFAFPHEGELRLGYWLGREFWGRGIASRAVAEFLRLEQRRPIYATVDQGNTASIRILENNDFEMTKPDVAAGLRYILGVESA